MKISRFKSKLWQTTMTMTIATVAIIVLLSGLAALQTQAAPSSAGTGDDPSIDTIALSAGFPISDTSVGDGLPKTVYLGGSGIITLDIGLSGTPPLTLTAGAAFGSPTRTLTSTNSPSSLTITYSVGLDESNWIGIGYTATNGSQVRTVVPITYIRDSAAPVASIVYPAPNSWVTRTVTFTGTATDGPGAGIQRVQVLTQAGGSWTTATGTTAWIQSWTLPDGQNGVTYTLSARATDYVDLLQDPAAARIIIADSAMTGTASNLTSTTHIVGTWSDQETMTLTWTPADDGPGSGLAGYAVVWDTVADTVPPNVQNLDPSAVQTTTTLGDGSSHYVHIRAVDQMQNWGPATHLGPFRIDTLAPTRAALLEPSNGTITNATNITFRWNTASDSGGSGVAGYNLDLDDTVFTTTTPYSNTVLDDGFYTWTVQAFDQLGHASGFTNTWTLEVDVTPPPVPTLLNPSNSAVTRTAAITLTWSGIDASGYNVRLNGTVFTTTAPYSPTVLDDGLYTWTVQAFDPLGQVSGYASTRTFEVDTTPPPVPILSSPANGTVTRTTALTLVWTDTDASSYNVRLDDVVYTTPVAYSPTMLVDGTYNWDVRARDALGNASEYTDPWVFELDTNPPAVPTLLSPSNGTVTGTAAVTLTWSGPDADSYNVLLDGTVYTTTLSYSPTVLDDGLYTWTVRGLDRWGNASEYASDWTFEVDTVPPPTPTLLSPASGTITNASTINFAWSDESAGGATSYVLDVGGTRYPTSATTLPVAPSANGSYTWTVQAIDGSGNGSAFAAPYDLVIDRTPPNVTITVPGGGSVLTTTHQLTFSLSGAATDGGTGVTQVQVRTETAWNTATGTQAWSYTWALPNTDQRPYTLTARATDGANNTGTSPNVLVTVDTKAPDADAPVPDRGPWISSSVVYNWPDSTDDASIAAYRINITNSQGYSQTFRTTAPSYSFTQASVEGAGYYARVQAIDANGNIGPWSDLSTVITPDRTAPTIIVPSIAKGTEPPGTRMYIDGLNLYYRNGSTLNASFSVNGYLQDALSGGWQSTATRAFNSGPFVSTEVYPSPFQFVYQIPGSATASGAITVIGYDQASNSVTQLYTYTQDSTPPGSTADAPPYLTDPDGEIAVSWVATDTQSGVYSTTLWYRKEVTGTWTPYQTLLAGSGVFGFDPPQGDGLYLFATVAADNLGNLESGPTVSETQTLVDTQPPRSQITWAPAYRNASPITMTWVATPSLVPLTQVRLWYRFNGGAWQAAATTGTGTSGVLSFVPPGGDGIYDLATVAQDTLGKTEANPTGDDGTDASTIYDTQAPAVLISVPQSGAVFTTAVSSVLITGTAVDATAGITRVQIQTDTTWVSANNLNPWSYMWALPTTDQRSYTLAARATDRATNEGTSLGVLVTVDTKAPNADAPVPDRGPWISSSVVYNWPDSTDDASIAAYRINITNSQGYSQTFRTTAPSYSFAQASVEGAGYRARVQAIDANGNVGPWSGLSTVITPDRTAPTIIVPSLTKGTEPPGARMYIDGLNLYYRNGSTLNASFRVNGYLRDTLSGGWQSTATRAFNSGPFVSTEVYPSPFQFIYQIPGSATASGVIVVTGYDQASNSITQLYTYTHDSTAPSSTADAPSYFTDPDQPIQVSWIATDTQSGVYSTTLWYRKEVTGTWTPYQTLLAGSGVFDFDPTQGDGLYFFATVAADNLGNLESGPIVSETQTRFNTNVPYSRINWAPDLLGTSPITMTWVATEALPSELEVRLWYRFNGGAWLVTAITGTGTSGVFTFTPPHGDGSYNLATVAMDQFGQSEAPPYGSGDATILYDTSIAPLANLEALPSSWSKNDLFTLTWDNPLDLTGIAGAYYKLDYAPISPTNGTWVPGDDLESITNLSVGSEGTHTVWVWLIDRAGNIAHTTARTVAVYYDASIAAPLGLSASPSTWTRTDDFELNWNNPFDRSGIVGAYYKLNIAPASATDGAFVPGNDLERINHISVGGEGAHVLYLWLRDAAGNIDSATKRTVTLRYDATPPVNLSITAPVHTAETEFDVSWSAEDLTSGMVSFSVEYSSTSYSEWQPWLSSVTSASATFHAPESEVDYVFRVTARDAAGNSAQAQTTTRVGLFRTYVPLVMRQWTWWYQYDIYEPNDSPSQAYGPLVSGQVYAAYIWDQTDQNDYYHITPSTSANVQVTLSQITAGNDYDLYIYDHNNGQYNLVAYSNNSGNTTETTTFTPIPGRKYYIRIYRYVGADAQHPYHLTATYQ